MVDLSDLLRPEAVATGVAAVSRKALLQQLGLLAAPLIGVDARAITDALAERERLGSTGFGGGVALPHARLPTLTMPVGLFVRLAHPIDFDAVDGVPVDLVFALFSPIPGGADHLKALARVSRRLRDRPFLTKLRGAGSPDALYALLTASETRDAA
ncbi:PTS sugar transporter subunit IIA [Sphingomonas rubra]|uniref:PTS IIA-like nitrogen-regulatory protein PtsN n=1 Tax=Sphingomonas rubra TaxID=634430 RepID=A0A1I5RD55_9SPHN|nr:PTS sugar transporter subunit IIA [Sphingomonas rubra]SFP56385.1 PTS IIA-like nitrogen-regulatory protein PtsN [Sphingomonas rubra]